MRKKEEIEERGWRGRRNSVTKKMQEEEDDESEIKKIEGQRKKGRKT